MLLNGDDCFRVVDTVDIAARRPASAQFKTERCLRNHRGRRCYPDRMPVSATNGVPIREDKALVTVLSKLNIDQEIPPQLYRAVAAILAFLYKANQKPG